VMVADESWQRLDDFFCVGAWFPMNLERSSTFKIGTVRWNWDALEGGRVVEDLLRDGEEVGGIAESFVNRR
jgi:hypothetical protein